MRTGLVGLALLAGLTACGGSSDAEGGSDAAPTSDAPTSETPSSEAPTSAAPSDSPTPRSAGDDLKAAVQAYSDAFLTGDADGAYGALSARCRDRVSAAEFGAVVNQAGDLYGDALPFKTYDAENNGKQARVTYTYAVSGIDQTQEPWVLEDGAWLEDDC